MRAASFSQPIYDGAWKLYEWDPLYQRHRWILDHGDGRVTIRTDQNVEGILEENKTAAIDASGKRWGDWARIASVPIEKFYDSGLHEAHRQGDDKFVSRFLNDSDYRGFRTREGQV